MEEDKPRSLSARSVSLFGVKLFPFCSSEVSVKVIGREGLPRNYNYC